MLASFVLLIIGFGAIALVAQDKQDALSDEELLDRYVNGDLAAFEVLYQRHCKSIFNFVLRSVHSPERAEELVQEVFMRLIQNASGYVQNAKFTTWLYTIARNLCIDFYRRKYNRPHLSLQGPAGKGIQEEGSPNLEGILEDPDAEKAGEARVYHLQIQKALESGIEGLSEEQREVFLLRESAHLPYQEIAKVVGASENTIKSRMRYALAHLRKHLQSLGFDPKDIEV